MIYEKYNGSGVSVNIENVSESDPYTEVGAKAFLSCKDVYEIKLPETICKINDWAFAHMKELKRITIPAGKISIGKDVFLDCNNLKEIVVYPDNSNNSGAPFLLASCITVLNAPELLDFDMAANQNDAWCELYDKKLVHYICQNDEIGFQPVIVGWFNDEGEEEQLTRYIEKTKSYKIRLSFLRLKYDANIDELAKETFLSYLKKQIKLLDDGDDLVWSILRELLSDDIQYAKLAVTNDLLGEELILRLIKYLNDNNASTEISAYLLLSLNGNNKNIDQQFEL